MYVEGSQLAGRTRLGKLTDLNRLVAPRTSNPLGREAREGDNTTRMVDGLLFDERSSPVTLTSNAVAPKSLVLVDRHCCQETHADDPVAAGPPPKYAHGRMPTHISVERLSNRDTDLIVALAHEPQRPGVVAARYALPTDTSASLSVLSSQTCIVDARRRQQPIAARRKGCCRPSHDTVTRPVRLRLFETAAPTSEVFGIGALTAAVVLSQIAGCGDARHRQAHGGRRGLLSRLRPRHRGLLRRPRITRPMDRVHATASRARRRRRSRGAPCHVRRAGPDERCGAGRLEEPHRRRV